MSFAPEEDPLNTREQFVRERYVSRSKETVVTSLRPPKVHERGLSVDTVMRLQD